MPAAAHAIEFWKAASTEWPIDRASLAALKDLGLPDSQVAGYFRVTQDDVARLRATYGIAGHARPSAAEPQRRRLPWRRRQ